MTWNYAYLAHQMHNFLRQGGSAPLQPPKFYICFNFDRTIRDWNHAFMVPKHKTFSYEKEGCPLPTTKKHITCISVNFDLKGPEIMHIQLAKYRIFLGKGALPPCNPPNGMYVQIVTEKGLKLFWFPQMILPWKGGLPPCDHHKSYYFCKFRLKRAWNYVYLARKIPNFLRQGGPAPLQPPRTVYRYNFWQ